jgi:hypothetical protein
MRLGNRKAVEREEAERQWRQKMWGNRETVETE